MPLLPELIDIIIDYLHNDKRSLSACCLTSKQWVTSCRFHLFSKMTVTPHRIPSLLHFLESHSTSIASLIRNLVVEDFSAWGTTSYSRDQLKRIFQLLRSVEYLHIHNCYHAIDSNVFSVLTNVRELVMEDIRLNSLQHTLSFVYAFPMLKTLSIAGKSTWRDLPLVLLKYKTRPGHPSFSLRKLDLNDPELVSSISKWLLGLDPVPPIFSLGLYAYGSQSSIALLRAIGPSIPTLELNFWNPSASPDSTRGVADIKNCMNLQKVHFRGIVRDPDILTSPNSLVVQMLSQIACLSVQELIFEFRGPDEIDFDWTFLANALADSKFDRLQVIRVEANFYSYDENEMVSERYAWQVAERSIRQGALSVSDRRGLFHFTLFNRYNRSRMPFGAVLPFI